MQLNTSQIYAIIKMSVVKKKSQSKKTRHSYKLFYKLRCIVHTSEEQYRSSLNIHAQLYLKSIG